MHLNLPGAPNGAFFDQGAVLAAVVSGRKYLPYRPGIQYWAAVDMSGGSSDNCVLCIGHLEGDKVIIDLIVKQAGNSYPFDQCALWNSSSPTAWTNTASPRLSALPGGDTFSFAYQKRGDKTFHLIKAVRPTNMKPLSRVSTRV